MHVNEVYADVLKLSLAVLELQPMCGTVKTVQFHEVLMVATIEMWMKMPYIYDSKSQYNAGSSHQNAMCITYFRDLVRKCS